MKTNSKPTLVILAAGIGSRYGSLKQLEAVGPCNETIMEYSIHDAIHAGFKKVVFVINKKHKELFENAIGIKYRKRIKIEYVFQELGRIPTNYRIPQNRTKPWGTGHAILATDEVIEEPFAVINADDYYGSSAFTTMGKFLRSISANSTDFCMIGYALSNTLSDHGGVSRGICQMNDDFLTSIIETEKIIQTNGLITGTVNNQTLTIKADAIVSMNFWGFTPKLFPILEQQFNQFLKNNSDNMNAEFFIPDPLDYAIKNDLINVRILKTNEKWLGVTYKADKKTVEKGIHQHIKHGRYPGKL